MSEQKSPTPADVVCAEELWTMDAMSPAVRRKVDEIVRTSRRDRVRTRTALRAMFDSSAGKVILLDRKRDMAELLSLTMAPHVPADLDQVPLTPAQLVLGRGRGIRVTAILQDRIWPAGGHEVVS
ncbi:hypothetical protein ACIPY5_19915 [Microbacterium sp. NPDC089698]|uniref:hypothetical protein n=1 Tax=Microbacterium sp. NPDC089698 TaxID=3364200 RepID=UPI00382CD93C